jgi:hypothetical protein
MGKINGMQSEKEMILALAEENTSAIQLLREICSSGADIDDTCFDEMFKSTKILVAVDMTELYGENLSLLHHNVCQGDLVKTMAMIRANNLGIISQADLKSIATGAQKIDVDGVVEKVQEKLPYFNKPLAVI